METLDLIQGTPEWYAHRRNHKNASEAPAMMGADKKTSRTKLLQMKATGAEKEFSKWVQENILDKGHEYEALARPLAAEIIGEALYPVTGVNGGYSASFDGLTMMEDVNFEHKSLNDVLRNAMTDDCTGADLPLAYQIQMESQHIVAECEKTLFMASKWEDGQLVEERHCWYVSNMELRDQIIAGWKQFDEDLENYQHVEAAPEVVAAPVLDLPAVSVQVSGAIAIIDNFEVFEVALRDFIDNQLIRKPETDQDFADLDTQIKTLKKAEAALDAAEAHTLSQVASIDAMKRTKDMLSDLTRKNRLMAEKLLEAEKVNRKVAIQESGKQAYAEHIEALNKRLGKPYMPALPVDFVGATKGLKSMDSAKDKVNTELARAKIAANEVADRIDLNLKSLRELAADHAFLFSDTPQLVLKPNDDLVNLIKLRISEHATAEQAKADALREQIRKEEEAKAKAKADAEVAAKAAETAVEPTTKESLAVAPEAVAPATRKIPVTIRGKPATHEEVAEAVGLPAKPRPTDQQIIFTVATAFDVDFHTAKAWIESIAQKAAA